MVVTCEPETAAPPTKLIYLRLAESYNFVIRHFDISLTPTALCNQTARPKSLCSSKCNLAPDATIFEQKSDVEHYSKTRTLSHQKL